VSLFLIQSYESFLNHQIKKKKEKKRKKQKEKKQKKK